MEKTMLDNDLDRGTTNRSAVVPVSVGEPRNVGNAQPAAVGPAAARA